MIARGLPRLLLRPMTVQNAFVAGSLVLALFSLFAALRGGYVDVAHVSAEQISRAIHVRLALGAVMIPMVIGALVGWSAFELLLCPFSAHLPGVLRSLRRGLLAAAILAALAAWWWADSSPGAQVPLPYLAGGFLWFAIGVLWVDPVFVSWPLAGRLGMLALLLLPIGGAPEVVGFLEENALVMAPVLLLVGLALLQVPFLRRVQRRRLEHPASLAHGAYREGLPLDTSARTRVHWSAGRPLQGVTDWARAALHEGSGSVRGGWIGNAFQAALTWVPVVLLVLFVTSVQRTGGIHAALEAMQRELCQGRGPVRVSESVVPVLTGLFLVLAPFTLGGAGTPPLSRRTRARVAWRASAIRSASVMTALAAGLGLATWILTRVVGSEAAPFGLACLRPVFAAAIFAPVPQAFRLRFVDGARRPGGANMSLLPLYGALLGLPAVFLSLVAYELRRDLPPVVQLLLALGLLLVVQRLWWRELQRHFTTRDLA